MLSLQWRYISVGERVLVHDRIDPLAPLRAGVVVVAEREQRFTRVAVRTTLPDGTDEVVWPTAIEVHPDPAGDTYCWRCIEATRARLLAAPSSADVISVAEEVSP